jgi:hypothetical protein
MTTQTVRNDGGKDQAAAQYASIVAMVERLDKANKGHDDNEQEEARDAIESDPLSVQVRSGWYTPTSEAPEAEEFQILLCTGGPAVRIVGELSSNQPDRAWLEFQDWFTPWTRFHDVDKDVLLTYARCFYFGE